MPLDSKSTDLYNILVDTLIMACSDLEQNSDDDLDEFLEELEGDHYTFFDRINLVRLSDAGALNSLQVENIASLKIMIGNIPANLWNVNSLKSDTGWAEVRKLSNEVLYSIGVSKRD